jgi:hypothetical protein
MAYGTTQGTGTHAVTGRSSRPITQAVHTASDHAAICTDIHL